MKVDLGFYRFLRMQEVISELLKKIIVVMKDIEIFVLKENDDLWEIIYI